MKKVILILACFILTGCYNYHELNDIAIASSVLIDYEDEEVKVTIQISGKDEYEVIEAGGKNVSESLNQAELVSDKSLSFYHLKAVFVSPNVDIEKVLLYLIRNPRINSSFYILYTNDLDLIDKNKDTDVGDDVYNMLKKDIDYTFFNLSSSLYNDNIDFYLPIINNELKIEGIMPYDKYKSTNQLNLNDINIFKLLNNEINSYINLKDSDGLIEININDVNTKISVDDTVEIKIDTKVSIVEYDSKIKNYDYDGI